MRTPAEIRPADVPDAAGIAAVYRPYVTDSIASFEAVAPDEAEMARRMVGAPRLPWFVACREGAVVGYAYAGPHRTRAAYRWSVDCSVYLTADERGAGTGRALYERLLPELTGLGHVTAFAGIALPNPAGVRLHEALGTTPVGVHRGTGFRPAGGTTSAGGSSCCARSRRCRRSRAPGLRSRGRHPLRSRGRGWGNVCAATRGGAAR